MGEFTAEDFAQAMFAVHPDPDAVDARYAARMNRDPEFPWLLDGVPGNGDEHMARDGWVPVVESRITEHTLRDLQEKAERKRQKLIAHIESVEAAVRDRNRTIEELRAARKEDSCRESAAHDRVVTLLDTKKTHERVIAELRHDLAGARKERERLAHDLRRSLGHPKGDNAITLDGLKVAWETAEVPTDGTPIREGDVVIVRHGGGFAVEPADRILSGQTHGRERILSRAPQREPHENLADAIREVWPSAYDEMDIGSLAYALHERGVGISKNGRE